jgi:hypothetical protein
MAILWTGAADAAIGCWDAQFTYNFWRPVTAVRAGGGNPGLVADADWTPLEITRSGVKPRSFRAGIYCREQR